MIYVDTSAFLAIMDVKDINHLTGLWPFLNVELGKIGRKTGHI
jgi:predicted nucleic acid-binding protein